MNISPSIQPENYRKLIARSFTLYRHAFSHIFLFALALSIISFAPRLFSLAKGFDVFANLQPMSPQRLWFILIDIAGLIFFSAMLWRIHCMIVGVRETLFNDFKTAIKKTPYIIVAGILQNAIFFVIFVFFNLASYFWIYYGIPLQVTHTFVGDLLMIITFLVPFFCFFYVFYELYFYLPIILIEDKGILAALKKSSRLVWTNWWRVFTLQITPWLVYLFVLILLKYLFKLNVHIFFMEPPKEYSLLTTSFHILFFAIFIPWVAATLLVQLRDLELRKQNYP